MAQPLISRSCCRLSQSQRSPANLLLRQCRRALSTSPAPSALAYATPIPEYLLPSQPLHLKLNPSRLSTLHHYQRQHRSFSATASSRATSVLLNPRVDDDGNPMTIDISPRAANRLHEITSTPAPSAIKPTPNQSQFRPHSHLRVTVTSGGCHGFQYLMSLEPSSKISSDEDTIFAFAEGSSAPSSSSSNEASAADPATSPTEEGDETAKVVLDSASLELLRGSTVDYTMELIGSQFKIVGNPRAKSSCGCGTSFDVE